MSREALTAALRLAKEKGNPEIRPGHILAGLLSQDKGIVGNLIRQIGADEGQVQRELQRVI
jgi:ATP-dependent Clp protease ATP-binding subunit ClpB